MTRLTEGIITLWSRRVT